MVTASNVPKAQSFRSLKNTLFPNSPCESGGMQNFSVHHCSTLKTDANYITLITKL